MRRNRLREQLNANQPTLGTRILSFWPTTIELIGHSKMFDYVEFSGEYAPYDHQLLENMGRAIELFDHLTGMIKIEQESRMHTAVRAIGAGFQAVLFADPRTADDARECVRVVRSERPQSGGLHGVNLLRSTGVVIRCRCSSRGRRPSPSRGASRRSAGRPPLSAFSHGRVLGRSSADSIATCGSRSHQRTWRGG